MSEGGIDAVVMDCNMPHMSGPAAARQMRALGYKGIILGMSGEVKRYLAARAFLISSHTYSHTNFHTYFHTGDDTASADFIQAGANGSLLKPVGRDELLTALSAHLSI
jgi:CheY-like chemotaxis protein